MPRAKNFAGRGIDSLSATDEDFDALFARHDAPRRTAIQDILIERIHPNPFQARRTFDGITELAEAIRIQGFVTRLRVRPDPTQEGTYQLVFGERRLRAAQQAGLQVVPCEIATHTDAELIEIGLAENIQRRDLSPLEEAHAFRALIDAQGYSERRLAERIGKDKGYVENRLALLRAPEDVQQLIIERPNSLRAAREIARLPTPEERRPLIEGIASGTLTQQDIQTLIRDRSTAAQRPSGAIGPVSPPSPSTTVQSPLMRALDRDIPALHAVFARWRLAAPHSDQDERARMLTYLDEHLHELEALAETLRSRQS